MGHRYRRSRTALGKRQNRLFLAKNHMLPKSKETDTHQDTRDISIAKYKRTLILYNTQNFSYIGQRKDF